MGICLSAGTTTQFPSGDDSTSLDDHAWWQKNAGGNSHPAGVNKANPFGLFDMHGNVTEWCADIFDVKAYAKASLEDPTGPNTGPQHFVIRGGNWSNHAAMCRSAHRNDNLATYRYNSAGFRVVRVLDTPTTTASATPQPAVPAAPGKIFIHDPAFQQWIKDVQAMPAEDRWKRSARSLVELNPGFDGKVTGRGGKDPPKVENGVVTSLAFFTENLTDISPVRALTD